MTPIELQRDAYRTIQQMAVKAFGLSPKDFNQLALQMVRFKAANKLPLLPMPAVHRLQPSPRQWLSAARDVYAELTENAAMNEFDANSNWEYEDEKGAF